ncbi:VC0807 family protein [Thermoactinospora rubra]|uniref:VC0807 family protein n=1 Tax=Thermoactinospora rubra TaxID=1088767 RepID=UPI000A102791|nr:VC0807 family protein [Thermoactinospora rubra]
MNHPPVTLPRLTSLLRQATPRLLEGVVAPMAVFYVAMAVLGLKVALLATIGWVYLCVVVRLVRGTRVPATMFVAALAITARAAISFVLDSWQYFLIQPELGTMCIAVAFLASVRLNRPLVQKLTLDYIHLPQAVLKHERVRRFFARITLLWAFVLLANSTVSIWLVLHQTLGGYMLIRTSVVAAISGLAIAFSILGFKRVLRRLHHAPA